MAILVTLQAAETSVQPGATVLVPFRVRNNSAVVDAFTFQVLGAAQGWAILEPSELPLLPGEEKEATIAFSPPRTAAVGAGRYVYGLQVMSRDDSGATTVEEGAIVVAPFSDLVATVTPQTAQAGASANVRVGIENRGNTAAQLTLRALDPDELLAFQIEQASLTVPPGASAEARVGIKHRGRTLRGQESRHRYQVIAQSADGAEVTVNGELVQRPYLAAWVPKAIAGAAAIAVLGVGALVFANKKDPKVDVGAGSTTSSTAVGVATTSTTVATTTTTPGGDKTTISTQAKTTTTGTTTTTTTTTTPKLESAELACKTGFVFRNAGPFDQVCVSQGTSDQAQTDNSQAATRRAGFGGSGPDTCKAGFVSREAFPLDLTCVLPATRSQAATDNSQAATRRSDLNSIFACKAGFVARQVVGGDLTCVTPAVRDQVVADNTAALSRREPAGGPSGPFTCKAGFVWREAVPLDVVCVTAAVRTQSATDNAAVLSRFANPQGGHACKAGFLWRQILSSDVLCVAQAVKDQSVTDNKDAPNRQVYPPGVVGFGTCKAGFVWREAFLTDQVCVGVAQREQAAADKTAAASRRVG